jgi:hypothetical protein
MVNIKKLTDEQRSGPVSGLNERHFATNQIFLPPKRAAALDNKLPKVTFTMLITQKSASPDSTNIRKSLLTYSVQLLQPLQKPHQLDVRGGPSAPSKLERTMTEGLGHYYPSFCFVGKSLGVGTGFSALSYDSRTLFMVFSQFFSSPLQQKLLIFDANIVAVRNPSFLLLTFLFLYLASISS